MNENLPSRKLKHVRKWKTILTKFIGAVIFIISILLALAAYTIFLSLAAQDDEAMKALGQNFGTIIIAVGVSFPTIIVAIFQVKYSEIKEKRKRLQNDLFSFVIAFVLFIGVNTVAIIALYSQTLNYKGEIIAIMIGSLIGLTSVFLSEIAKLLK
ncbi:hypothetical protein [Brevibacillus sp. FIR094]|uniref:hypothetical protein n=1 Tax=Brevibacillus sp. FIR094 TaxID=3134809 RepID=UPI003D257014